MMMLNLKHWQVFVLLVIGLFLCSFEVQGNPMLTVLLQELGLLLSFSWAFFVGHGLYQLLPQRIAFNYSLFIINAFILSAIFSFVVIVAEGQAIKLSGLAALGGFYVLYAMLAICMFPARLLRSLELQKKASISESMGDFLLIAFLPIGIWFLQPRINRIVEMESQVQKG